ncbi:MAG: hypothetical protein ACQEUK_04120 [Pseudomonadota bacterium]
MSCLRGNDETIVNTWRLIEERYRNGYTSPYHWEAGLLVRVIDGAQRATLLAR